MKAVAGEKGCSPLRAKSQKRIDEQHARRSSRSGDSSARYQRNHSPLRSSLSKRRSNGNLLAEARSDKSVRFEDQRHMDDGIRVYGDARPMMRERYQPLRRDTSSESRQPPISQFERSDAMRKIRQHQENINKVQAFINSQGGILKNKHELETSREKELRHPLRRASVDGGRSPSRDSYRSLRRNSPFNNCLRNFQRHRAPVPSAAPGFVGTNLQK